MATEGARPMNRSPTIAAIYRYPVKGLSAESLVSTRLAAGQTIAADRLYAIENGPSGFDPAAPAYLPKQRFLMLMRNERLARLQARFDAATHMLAIELEGARVASAARVKIVKRIRRCAATEVDPLTAARDLPIPGTLLRAFGNGDCGVYAEVMAGGEIAVGDAVAESD